MIFQLCQHDYESTLEVNRFTVTSCGDQIGIGYREDIINHISIFWQCNQFDFSSELSIRTYRVNFVYHWQQY